MSGQLLWLIWCIFPKSEAFAGNPQRCVTFSRLIMLEMKLICWCPTAVRVCFPVLSNSSVSRSDIQPCLCVCVCRPEGQNVRWSLTHTRTRAENITNEVEWWMAGHYLCLGSEKQARLDVLNISLHGKEPSLLLMKLDKAVAYSSFNTEPLSESSGISGSAPPPVTSHESDWYT